MFDFEIAFVLYKISKILAIYENNKYKAEAYHKAAMAIDAYDSYASILASRDQLTEMDGVGKSSAKIVNELLETGACELLTELEEKYSINDYSLLLSHGLKGGIMKKLVGAGITTYDRLMSTIEEEILADLFKPAERKTIYKFVDEYAKVVGRYLYSYAFCLGNELVNFLRERKIIAILDLPWQEKVEIIHLSLLHCDAEKVFKMISGSPRYLAAELMEDKIICRTQFGIPIEIGFVEELSERVAETRLLRGDLHMHSDWSDGKHSIEQMAVRAKELGCEYIGITDHSYSLRVANGISEVDALRQIDEIHRLKLKGIKVLAGIEVEVLKDGSLDFSDAVLSQFDYVIAGIHTFLDQPLQELLKRIEKALSNPYVNIFAHPTSRLLGRAGVLFSERGPYSVPACQIIEMCKKYNVIVEFNCFPERFDISPVHFKHIIDCGVMVSVGTDSHSAAHLSCLQYGEIAVQENPYIRDCVINCFDYKKLMKYFSDQRLKKIVSPIEEKNIVVHDFYYYFGSNEGIISGKDAVIGIDLTGNETKPSGWALMRGNYVETAMICSDEELIAASLKYMPRVVSIDSPLSYPAGRHCADPDCECAKYGITRYCERLLSSFGIGVYPCLIPSMVSLTTRGMLLARKFRDLGVEVIESYPGVAQDILCIRRKQNGLQHLKNGYMSFGLKGDFYSSETVKHDELDSIASALVGLFYINKQYIALGNDNENYLIVPSVSEKPRRPIVLGLTGNISSGKTTLAEYLKFKHGFGTFRYSDVICQLYNCKYDRAKLQKLGEEISKDPARQRELSLAIIDLIERKPDCHYVVDGLRHQLDYEMLSQHFGDRFSLLYIESSFSNAFRRYNKHNNCHLSKDDFASIYNAPSESDILSLLFTGNAIRVKNDGTYKEYFEYVERILKENLCQ